MQHDPRRVADTKAWLLKAAKDLRSADLARAGEPPVLSDAVYHCQQAVEKALKALLTWHDQPFRRTHNLVELGEQCARIEPGSGAPAPSRGSADGVRLEVPVSRRRR